MAAFLADDIFKLIFLGKNIRILIQISVKFVPKGSIDNKPALVQVMAWRRTGDKPLPEPMMTQWRIYVALGEDELTGRVLITKFHNLLWYFLLGFFGQQDL